MCKCFSCKLPICNLCSEPELDEGVDGWISGKQVGYCYSCFRKVDFKVKCVKRKREDRVLDGEVGEGGGFPRQLLSK